MPVVSAMLEAYVGGLQSEVGPGKNVRPHLESKKGLGLWLKW
jgi:hypothetical protein